MSCLDEYNGHLPGTDFSYDRIKAVYGCPTCAMYKDENARLWHEVDVLLKMVEQHVQTTEVIYDTTRGDR